MSDYCYITRFARTKGIRMVPRDICTITEGEFFDYLDTGVRGLEWNRAKEEGGGRDWHYSLEEARAEVEAELQCEQEELVARHAKTRAKIWGEPKPALKSK